MTVKKVLTKNKQRAYAVIVIYITASTTLALLYFAFVATWGASKVSQVWVGLALFNGMAIVYFLRRLSGKDAQYFTLLVGKSDSQSKRCIVDGLVVALSAFWILVAIASIGAGSN